MKKLLSVLLLTSFLFADTSGPLSGTGAGTSWTNPTNVSANDAAWATQSVGSTVCSTALSISAIGFAIPTGATINGIQTQVVGKASRTSALRLDNFDGCAGTTPGVQLTKVAATGIGTKKTNSTTWVTTNSTFNFGSTLDLWGTTFSPAEVNASGFGFLLVIDNSDASFSVTASVDYMSVTVTYTPLVPSGMGRRIIRSSKRQVVDRHVAWLADGREMRSQSSQPIR
jgi:hypothetical protein